LKAGFGVVGVGNWGESHAMVYASHPKARLVAVCDTNEARATDVAQRYGAARAYTDYEELLADPEVDAISIATPDFAHRPVAIAAARAGKHILLEKPLATTNADAQAIADEVRRSGIKMMLDFHNRWNPAMCIAKQAVANGEIGALASAYIRLHDTIFVPTRMLSWAGQSSALWFLGSHCLDLLRWMVDDEVKTVYCVSSSRVLRERGIDTPDFFCTTLQFRNGVVAVMENSWILPESEPVIIDFKLDLVGSDGAVNVDVSHNRTVQKYTRDKATYPNTLTLYEVEGQKLGFVLDSIRYWVDCVVEDRQPRVGLDDGLLNTLVLCAAEQSARTGLPVDIP